MVLRNLATLQDIYHNGSFRYSSDADVLDFVTSDGVTVVITPGATGQGWSASAAHLGLPGETCAIFHGNAAPLSPATVESQFSAASVVSPASRWPTLLSSVVLKS